ncbi:MAG TPA: beta-propeller domain-containing protein, partial [Polyangiaceae bacterium]
MAWLVALSLGSFACASDHAPSFQRSAAGAAGSNDPGGTPVEGDGTTDFVSDNANRTGGPNTDDGAESGTGGTTSSAPGADAGGDGDGPERAISEADIVQIEGDTLYALSRYSGLTIIDLSNPADLRVLGSYRSTAVPFEMYLEDGTAYIMFNGYAHRELDEETGSYAWVTSSRMLALDVSRPERPELIGLQDLAGEVSDSRKVGDVVYVVTHENGDCWQCDSVSNTRVSSYDVSDPSRFVPVDQERFEDPTESWGVRHVSVSENRLYVSGYRWSSSGVPEAGSIQVVDISDPGGDLRPGAVVEVTGQIDNRWQMDEHDGVLRVISQPGSWTSLAAPVVETFAIESSDDLTPLASLPMILPRPESLQSVRFDGTRAFAVTFEQTDPLFTFDLSDPAR